MVDTNQSGPTLWEHRGRERTAWAGWIVIYRLAVHCGETNSYNAP
jgi:hypothetical protein